jgi:F-type H+-transporting ATPase subunit c
MAAAVIGAALGQGKAIAASVEATARQPEAGGRIFTAMILGVAFIETLVLFTFAIMAFYLTPQLEAVVKALVGPGGPGAH